MSPTATIPNPPTGCQLPSRNSLILSFPGSWFKTVATAKGFDRSAGNLKFWYSISCERSQLEICVTWLVCRPTWHVVGTLPIHLNLLRRFLGWGSAEVPVYVGFFLGSIHFLREGV